MEKAQSSTETSPLRLALVFGSLVLLWGSTWAVVRVGVAEYPPFFGAFARFCPAALILLGIQKIKGQRLALRLEDQPFFLSIAVLSYPISYGVVYWAEQYISSGLAAVIFALLPLFTGIVGHHLLASEPLSALRLAGLLVGLGGIVLINLDDLSAMHPKAPMAALLMLASPIAIAVSTVIAKRGSERFDSLDLAAMPMAWGALMLGILWLVFERDRSIEMTSRGLGSLVYLCLFGSVVTFAGYYWLLRRIQVWRLNLLAYLTPLVALLIGWAWLDESISVRLGIGTAAVLIGVSIANRAESWKAVEPTD